MNDNKLTTIKVCIKTRKLLKILAAGEDKSMVEFLHDALSGYCATKRPSQETECSTSEFSSRMCEKGTKGCMANHMPEGTAKEK